MSSVSPPSVDGPRVLMIVEKLHGLGGAQKQALRLSRALRAHGVSTRVVTGRWRYGEPARSVIDEVEVRSVFTAFKCFHLRGLRKFSNYIYLASLLGHLRRHRGDHDLIHVHSASISALGAVIAGRRYAKPTIMKVMASGGWSDLRRLESGGEYPGSAGMLRRLRGVDRVICLNREVEEECLAHGFERGQLAAIPNGFPVREVVPRESWASGDVLRIVFAGRLDRQKNPALLLEALAVLREGKGTLRCRLDLLGDGPERSALEAKARALSLEDSVRFHGRVDDPAVHTRAADLFVLPSLSEGISNALLEAMAQGLPCIATDIPGNRDLIRDGETGLLVPTGDPGALAHRIALLAGDEGLRASLGRAARRLVEVRFDIDSVAREYAALYRGLLARV